MTTNIDDLINSTTSITEITEEVIKPDGSSSGTDNSGDSDTVPSVADVPVTAPAPAETPIPAPAATQTSSPAAQVSQADQIIAKLFARIGPPTDVKHRKVFLYGPPGCGKTVFSATAPKPLIVRVEPTGTLSLLNHPELLSKVQTFEFLSVAQLEILIETIIANPEKFDMFETFVVDSLSELQRIDLDTIIAREYKKDSDRNQYTRTWPDYNENTVHMAQLAGKLCRLPMNVIVTCHSKDKEDKGKGINITQPSLTDVLAEKCAGFFDIFAYMSCTDDGKRAMQVAPTRTVIAKTRVGGLPAVVAEPTWDKLFGHLPTNG